jgi:hypothetical protein
MANAYPLRTTQPEAKCHFVRLDGAGAAAPTKTYGDGVTVARSGAGVLTLTWTDTPGTFLGATFGFGATTASDVDGFTACHGAYSTTTLVLPVNVFSDTPAAADLPANTSLTIIVWFKTTAV